MLLNKIPPLNASGNRGVRGGVLVPSKTAWGRREGGCFGVKPKGRMAWWDRSCFVGLFCANETLLNLMTDRGDLSLELELFSYHCNRLRHTEALQPLLRDGATLTVICTGTC